MRRLKILLLLIWLPLACNATHIVGGGFEYRRVPGQAHNYLFKLTLYFDDINGNPGAVDETVTCHIFAKGSLFETETITMPVKQGVQYMPFTNPECANGAAVRTRILIYEQVVTLLPENYDHPAGYYIIWERCCRNQVVSNIYDPGQAGQTFYMEFPPVVRTNNQPFANASPVFANIFSDYPCINQPFTLSFGATDADGDSLVYTMVNPIKGNATSTDPVLLEAFPAPYPLVDWRPGYSAVNAIPGNPALGVDSKTGLLTCRPAMTGLFVFSVRCQEFRNGIKIGEVRREMQLLVKDCAANTPPVLTVSNDGDLIGNGDTLRLLSSADKKCYTYRISEEQLNQRVKLSVLPLNSVIPNFFKDTTLTFSATQDTLDFRFCVPACTATPPGQPWKILFLATDNGCPVPKSDTLQLTVEISPAPIEKPLITRLQSEKDTVSVVQTKRLEIGYQASQPQNGPVELSGYLIDSAGKYVPIGENGVLLPSGTGTGVVTGQFVWPEICYLPEKQPLKLVAIATTSVCNVLNFDTAYTWIYIKENRPEVWITSDTPPENTVQLRPGQSFGLTITGHVTDQRTVSNRALGELSQFPGFRFSPTSGIDSTTSDVRFDATCQTAGGSYTASFIASNRFCNQQYEDTLTYSFKITPDVDSLGPIPNLITANNDGRNDGFSLGTILPEDNCYFTFDFVEIYNRWGDRVFYSTDRNFLWHPEKPAVGIFYFGLHFKERFVKNWIQVVR